jgi:20S proteasome alpha/beta subunit
MSVVVWDGKRVASDLQGQQGDLRMKSKKIFMLEDSTVLAFTGEYERGLALVEWYKNGATPSLWPASQADKENWVRLIVVPPKGKPFCFKQLPFRQIVEEKFAAWGSGRDYALGALAKGADAIEAVRIASRFCTSCGMGVESFKVR